MLRYAVEKFELEFKEQYLSKSENRPLTRPGMGFVNIVLS